MSKPVAQVQLDRLFYNVLNIKEGGFGRVWLLERPKGADFDTIYGQRRAAKTFDNVEDQEAVVSELCNWVDLHHPAIVPLIKISRLDFRIAALMEMKLGTLDDLIRSRALGWAQIRLILLETCLALQYAYTSHRLVHLDLKPNNILINQLWPCRVQVADWGISRLASQRAGFGKAVSNKLGRGAEDFTQFAIGTPLYMAPERFTGAWQIGPAADIFAVGMIGIKLLTGGKLPHDFGDSGLNGPIQKIINGHYFESAQRLLAEHPGTIRRLLLSCIHPQLSRRHGDYSSLIKAVKAT